ncbi:MAG TPA: hypothetical protein VF097_11955 [Actinomycetota bacterium]
MAAKMRSEFRRFAMVANDPEAVIQRIGRDTWDCLVMDVGGTWTREVFPSQEAAEEACRALEIRYQLGWEDQRLAQRMNRRDHWGEPGGQRRAV